MGKYRKKKQSVVLAMQIAIDSKVDDAIKLFGENPVHVDEEGKPYIIKKESFTRLNSGSFKFPIIVPIEWGDYIVKESDNDDYLVMNESEFLKRYEIADEQEPNRNEVIHQIHNHFNISIEGLSELTDAQLKYFVATLQKALKIEIKSQI